MAFYPPGWQPNQPYQASYQQPNNAFYGNTGFTGGAYSSAYSGLPPQASTVFSSGGNYQGGYGFGGGQTMVGYNGGTPGFYDSPSFPPGVRRGGYGLGAFGNDQGYAANLGRRAALFGNPRQSQLR